MKTQPLISTQGWSTPNGCLQHHAEWKPWNWRNTEHRAAQPKSAAWSGVEALKEHWMAAYGTMQSGKHGINEAQRAFQPK